MVKWHKDNPEQRVYVPLKDGKKAPLPRYFKQKIYDEYEKEKISFHWKNKSDLLKEKEISEHGDNLISYKAEQYFNGERKLKNNHHQKI